MPVTQPKGNCNDAYCLLACLPARLARLLACLLALLALLARWLARWLARSLACLPCLACLACLLTCLPARLALLACLLACLLTFFCSCLLACWLQPTILPRVQQPTFLSGRFDQVGKQFAGTVVRESAPEVLMPKGVVDLPVLPLSPPFRNYTAFVSLCTVVLLACCLSEGQVSSLLRSSEGQGSRGVS